LYVIEWLLDILVRPWVLNHGEGCLSCLEMLLLSKLSSKDWSDSGFSKVWLMEVMMSRVRSGIDEVGPKLGIPFLLFEMVMVSWSSLFVVVANDRTRFVPL
jgi:hypothetical protein